MLFQLPYGIIGVSILTAIMPRMSRHAAAGQIAEMKDDASLANRLSIVALMPVAAAMIVLAGALAIIASLYGAVEPGRHHGARHARWPRWRSAWCRSR